MSWRYCHREVLPFAAMVSGECFNVGINIIFKAATLKGMSFYIFLTYSYAIANFTLLPFVFIFHRSGSALLPPLKFPFISRVFLLSLIGYFAQLIGYKGIEYSSPTLASTISSLTPAFTFILAIIFRMEKVALRRSSSQAKILGTIVSISGALVVVLYKGPTVFSSTSSVSLQLALEKSLVSNWVIGGVMLAIEWFLLSLWYIIQTQIMEMCPAEFLVVFLYNICGTIISIPVCLIAEPNLRKWVLRPNVEIASVVYTGTIGIFITVIHTWGLHLKGPVYVASFKPLAIAIAAAMSALFLGDALHLGSVIGAVILSTGFYAVLWGKAKEEEIADHGSTLLVTSTDDQLPLLQSYKIENEGRTTNARK